MKDGRIKIGVVGMGYWGPNIARNVNAYAGSSLTWLCDARGELLADASVRFPSVRTTTSFDEMLADPDLDAVAIATPASTHHPLADAALRAGKHVFVEKPLAASAEEAVDLIESAQREGLVLMPGHTFLYSPPVVMIKEIIDSGVLGDIYFISMSRVNLGIHQSDVSVVWDLGPHDFSILRYWLGESPAEVSGMVRDCVFPGTPDVAFLNARFSSGTVAHIELAWLSPSKLRRTAIVGSSKMIVYDDTSQEPVRIFDSGAEFVDPATFGEYRLSYRTGDIVSPKLVATEPLALEIADFCTSILDGAEPRSSAAIGLDVVRTIEAVDRSLALNGATVPTVETAGS